jgi:hypothetical protein
VAIPEFREDGYLPEGLHRATEAEVLFRFGSPTRRRRALALHLRHWLQLVRAVESRRFFIGGSFVTAKPSPGDLDAVVWISDAFEQEIQSAVDAAIELEEILTTRQTGDLFAAEDDADWVAWVEFFTRTREADGRRKGVVEVVL